MPAPKSEEQRRLEGYPDHRPARAPVLIGGRLVAADPIPVPPGLDDWQRQAWSELVAVLIPSGQIDRADLWALEMQARSLGRTRQADAMLARDGLLHTNSQGVVAHPGVAIANASSAEARAWSRINGIGPANRALAGFRSGAGEGGGSAATRMASVLPMRARLRVERGEIDADDEDAD